MFGSTYGNTLKISTWGESHGKALGVVVDGCPAGLSLCEEDIQVFLDRRKPGQSAFTTQRNEGDLVDILSGVFEGKTTGTPISMIVRNKEQRSKITAKLQIIIVRDMPIIHLTKNLVLGIIVVADALQDAKLSDELQQVPLLQKF